MISTLYYMYVRMYMCVCYDCSKEMEYAAVVNVNGVLGDHVSFSVSGNGSADEATLS